MIDQIKLLELMSARICHDLAGPIGAVNNSLEFFEEEKAELRERALQIVKSSSAESVLRLKFFRQAYGSLSDKEIAVSEIKTLINEFLEKTKSQLEWECAPNEEMGPLETKIILNFIIIALSSLVYGGIIRISKANDAFKISFLSNNFIFLDLTKSILNGLADSTSINSSNVQLYYTYLLIKKAQHTLIIDQNNEGIEFLLKRD